LDLLRTLQGRAASFTGMYVGRPVLAFAVFVAAAPDVGRPADTRHADGRLPRRQPRTQHKPAGYRQEVNMAEN
jgi:hypothetical protein